MLRSLSICLVMLTLVPAWANAQGSGSRDFGPYTVFYSVVNSTFVSPEVAGRYGIVRGKDRAFINIAIRENLPDGGSTARRATLEGRTWDLFRNQFLEFQEVKEQESIYYIAEFKFDNEDIRFFKVELRPEGAQRSYEIKFNHRVYEEQ